MSYYTPAEPGRIPSIQRSPMSTSHYCTDRQYSNDFSPTAPARPVSQSRAAAEAIERTARSIERAQPVQFEDMGNPFLQPAGRKSPSPPLAPARPEEDGSQAYETLQRIRFNDPFLPVVPRRSPSPSLATSDYHERGPRDMQRSQPMEPDAPLLSSAAYQPQMARRPTETLAPRRSTDRSARSASPMRHERTAAGSRTRSPPRGSPSPRPHKGSRGYLAPLDAIGTVGRSRAISNTSRTAIPTLPPLTIPLSRSPEPVRGRLPSNGLRSTPDYRQQTTRHPAPSAAVITAVAEPARPVPAPKPAHAEYAAPTPRRSHVRNSSVSDYLSLEQLEDLWQTNDVYAGTIEAPSKPRFTMAQILEARTYMDNDRSARTMHHHSPQIVS